MKTKEENPYLKEFVKKYSFPIEEQIKEGKISLHPIYHKWLPACWNIEKVYAYQQNEDVSLGKARELTSAIIEEVAKEYADQETAKMREAVEQPVTSHSELIAFASYLAGHDEETIQQMYDDWSKHRRI